MIGADGAGADKAHLGAFEQGPVDVGHRAHQQHIGLLDGGAVNGTAGHPAYFAKSLEESIEQRNIFVGNNQHGRLLWRNSSVQGCDRCSTADRRWTLRRLEDRLQIANTGFFLTAASTRRIRRPALFFGHLHVNTATAPPHPSRPHQPGSARPADTRRADHDRPTGNHRDELRRRGDGRARQPAGPGGGGPGQFDLDSGVPADDRHLAGHHAESRPALSAPVTYSEIGPLVRQALWLALAWSASPRRCCC